MQATGDACTAMLIPTHPTLAINCTSSGAFADDLISLSGSYQNLRLQAIKLTQYADWARLIISGPDFVLVTPFAAKTQKHN
jgi:hypothetical protein